MLQFAVFLHKITVLTQELFALILEEIVLGFEFVILLLKGDYLIREGSHSALLLIDGRLLGLDLAADLFGFVDRRVLSLYPQLCFH